MQWLFNIEINLFKKIGKSLVEINYDSYICYTLHSWDLSPTTAAKRLPGSVGENVFAIWFRMVVLNNIETKHEKALNFHNQQWLRHQWKSFFGDWWKGFSLMLTNNLISFFNEETFEHDSVKRRRVNSKLRPC